MAARTTDNLMTAKRILCPHLPTKHKPSILSENEAHHATHVMRLRDGAQVEALDGNGNKTLAILRTKGGPTRLECNTTDSGPLVASADALPTKIILETSILKGIAMEWLIEKSVELGIDQLVPLMTDHTVVQIKGKGPDSFRQRWTKIADQALKQCGRLTRMEISHPLSLTESLATEHLRLWCDEASRLEAPYLMNFLVSESHRNSVPEIRILIGPEGGWSVNERNHLLRQKSLHRVHLGPNVFRAETAALFACSVVMAHFRYRLSEHIGPEVQSS